MKTNVWFLRFLLFVGFFILFARLFELQVIKGEYFRNLSDSNRIRRVPIVSARGKIIARGGEVLVDNKEVKKTVKFGVLEGVTKTNAEENTPEDELIVEWQRTYPLSESFSHLSGYIGEVNEEEVLKVDPNCVVKGVRKYGAFVGRGGLEQYYDCVLRGVDGEELVEVDTMGRKIRVIGRKESMAGSDLKTTIDYPLQKVVFDAMKGTSGAAVVTDGRGQILSLVSSPGFDPNLFLNGDDVSRQNISKLFTNKSLPLFNRAVGGAYHPGSIYKLVSAIAGIEEGKITPSFTYEDTGVVSVNEFSYTNWYFTQYGGREGVIDLKKALARSTDTFFYKVGEMVGIDRLAFWSREFGLGSLSGIDLPGEVSGLVPTPEWKEAVKGERWFLGNTYHMSIGQGDLIVTPLQANIMTSVVANGGNLCRSYINMELGEDCHKLDIKKESLAAVIEGMTSACETGGTAFPFFDFFPKVACKTGTAETFDDDKTHAWFTVFDVDDPEIVLTLIVENGGEGSKVAAPIARTIFDYWFHDRKVSN